jgi:hypothetical protein
VLNFQFRSFIGKNAISYSVNCISCNPDAYPIRTATEFPVHPGKTGAKCGLYTRPATKGVLRSTSLLSWEASPYSVGRARKLWNERVQAGGLTGERRWVVVIDEAQDISDEMLQELRFVRNQKMDAVSPFPLILVGQPELRRKLRLKKYEAVSQRIEMVYHLTGMTREETADYVRHQIRLTGKAAPLFTDSALHLIYGASRGIPWVVNQICLQALYDAAAKNSDVVEDAHIQRVLADQEWQRGSGWITGCSYTPEVTDGTTTTKMAECRYNSHANGGEKFTAKQRERLQHPSFRPVAELCTSPLKSSGNLLKTEPPTRFRAPLCTRGRGEPLRFETQTGM